MKDDKSPQKSAEVRAKIAESVRESWKNKENRSKRIEAMSKGLKKAWEKRDENGLGQRANGSFQENVKQQISDSVKKRWEEGSYKDRLNGMTGRTGANHHNWTWGILNFREILLQYEEAKCAYCGVTLKEEKLDVHHIDENHENYLLSNLQWDCVPCHMYNFHYRDTETRVKYPFVTLSKRFSFEYAHILPWHPGKCSQLHGHSGHLEIEIVGRINSLGIVEDFYDISAAVKTSVIEPFDHQFLNDFIDNPTTENLLVEIWHRLESIGLKGLRKVKFSETDSSSAELTQESMVEAFGWDLDKDGKWNLVSKIDFDREKVIWSMGHALTVSEGTERRLHGHNWGAIFSYGDAGLNKEIFGKMQQWVDDNLDERSMIQYDHPALSPYCKGEAGFSDLIECLGFMPVAFDPNPGNIAKFLHREASSLLNLNPTNLSVTVIEAPYMSSATFNGSDL